MHLTQAEIVKNLGLSGMRPIAVPTAFSNMELGLVQLSTLFKQFAGESVAVPPNHLLETTVCYLVHDAVCQKPLDVAGAIARTERLAERMPSLFSVTAAQIKAEARDIARAERLAALGAVKAASAAVEGEVKRRGRKTADGETAYDKAVALMLTRPELERDAMIKFVTETLGVAENSVRVYYYKAKRDGVC